jgi:hypothetical protein
MATLTMAKLLVCSCVAASLAGQGPMRSCSAWWPAFSLLLGVEPSGVLPWAISMAIAVLRSRTGHRLRAAGVPH